MSTCLTCPHWHKPRQGSRLTDESVGECHATPPGRDFTWPRTKAIDTCGQHPAKLASFATGKPFDASPRAGAPAGAVEPAAAPSTAPQTEDLALGLPARTAPGASTPDAAGQPASRRSSRSAKESST